MGPFTGKEIVEAALTDAKADTEAAMVLSAEDFLILRIDVAFRKMKQLLEECWHALDVYGPEYMHGCSKDEIRARVQAVLAKFPKEEMHLLADKGKA